MFDGKGVRLHNSRFSLDHDRGGQIILDPTVGFALGQNGMFEFDDDGKVVFNESKANAYIDMNGKLRIKSGIVDGDFYANNLYFNDGGDVKTLLDQATKKISSDLLDVRGLNVNNNFIIDEKGNVTINNGSISWGAVTGTEEIDKRIENAQSTANGAANSASSAANNLRKLSNGTYGGGTFIDGKSIFSPEIYGTNIYGANIYAGYGDDAYASMKGDGLYIYSADNTTVPKMQLVTGNSGNSVILMLGEGDGVAGINDRFMLRKNPGHTILRYFGANAKACGFDFLDNGTIEVVGKLNGVTAVFGE